MRRADRHGDPIHRVGHDCTARRRRERGGPKLSLDRRGTAVRLCPRQPPVTGRYRSHRAGAVALRSERRRRAESNAPSGGGPAASSGNPAGTSSIWPNRRTRLPRLVVVDPGLRGFTRAVSRSTATARLRWTCRPEPARSPQLAASIDPPQHHDHGQGVALLHLPSAPRAASNPPPADRTPHAQEPWPAAAAAARAAATPTRTSDPRSSRRSGVPCVATRMTPRRPHPLGDDRDTHDRVAQRDDDPVAKPEYRRNHLWRGRHAST